MGKRMGLILSALSGFALGEELPEVSVTATRTQREVKDVPASVRVIGKEEVEQKPMFNLSDILSGTPGVNITSRNQGYDTRLIIRGAGLKAPFGIREIMVLLNGV
ncbi:MAG: TonB-dependent receptor plug domain-containing protein, partial [Aquificaceae bacterium]